MSKAMDALERMIDTIGGCTCTACKQNVEDGALLRDYITTTEAKGEALAITAGNLMIEREESAARIKELEEAIDCAMGSIARSNLQKAVEYLSATVVISGARKVERTCATCRYDRITQDNAHACDNDAGCMNYESWEQAGARKVEP
jgi:hypothetical protein